MSEDQGGAARPRFKFSTEIVDGVEEIAYPVKPGDWVARGDMVARVKDVYTDEHDGYLCDLVIWSLEGKRIGRQSPREGGPRGFEPAVTWSEDWRRINKPNFPIQPKWLPVGNGFSQLGYDLGPSLEERRWVRPHRKGRVSIPDLPKSDLIEALRAIAAGHNDARGLAQDVLRKAGLI